MANLGSSKMKNEQGSFKEYAKKPTILQVIPSLKSGGVEVGTFEVGKAIVDAGGHAIVAAKGVPSLTKDTIKEIEFIDLPLDKKSPIRILKNIKYLKNLIQEKKVDIVHARSRAPAWSAYYACRALGIPFVTTHHAAYNAKTIFKTYYNSIMVKGDLIIATSRFIQNHLFEKYAKYSWFDTSKIRLIERGIDLDYFNPDLVSDHRVQEIRQNWGFPPTTRIILMPGRISKRKGQDTLIKALSLVQHRNTAIVLLGSAEGHEHYKNKLIEYAASLGLEGRVKWMAPTSELATAYKAAEIIVSSSKLPEGFGRTLAEAQAMEKPIISTNHGASHEIIEDGITGWLTPPKNPIALAKVLEIALNLTPSELKTMGQKGRERAESLFSNKLMAYKTINVYKELIPIK